MAYEIPQQMQYKERIIFGLTFQQLGWALLFGIPAFVAAKAFQSDLKWVFVAFCVVLAASFMFLDLASHIKHAYHFMFRFKEGFLLDPSMNEFLEIEKIEKGIIYVKNKKQK
jgi:hypothetical protein